MADLAKFCEGFKPSTVVAVAQIPHRSLRGIYILADGRRWYGGSEDGWWLPPIRGTVAGVQWENQAHQRVTAC